MRIISAAGEIASISKDNQVGKRTVFWKIYAIPYFRSTLHGIHPLASLVDGWVLCTQMREFFETGEAATAFGEHTHLAVEAMTEIEEDITRLASSVLPGDIFSKFQKGVSEFAREHPMRGAFGRESARPALAQASQSPSLSWVLDSSLAPLRAIGGLDQTAVAIHEVAGVADEIKTVASHLPEEIHWHAELLAYEIESKESVVSALKSFAALSASAESLSETARKLPAELRAQATAVLEDTEKTQNSLRETMKEAQSTLLTVDKTIKSADETSQNLSKAGKAWEDAIQTIWDMVNDLKGDPEEEPSQAPEEEGRPFDILDYAKTADEVADAGVKLQAAVQEVRQLVKSKEVAGALEHSRLEAEALATHTAWCFALSSIVVLLVFFALIFSYRLATARLPKKNKA
jgi:hypothetical protein